MILILLLILLVAVGWTIGCLFFAATDRTFWIGYVVIVLAYWGTVLYRAGSS